MNRLITALVVLVGGGADGTLWAAEPAKVPILYSTDLYHPHGDQRTARCE